MIKLKKGKSKTRLIKLAAIKREIKYGNLSLPVIGKRWFDLCTRISIPNLKNELTCIWHTYEKVMDMKDLIISLCMDELRNQEEMHNMNFQNHQLKMNELMSQLFEKLQDIHTTYEKNLNSLIKNSLALWDKETIASNLSEIYLKTMSFRSETENNNSTTEIKTQFFAKIKEQSTVNSSDITNVYVSLKRMKHKYLTKIKKIKDDYFQFYSELEKQNKILEATNRANHIMMKKELRKLLHQHEIIKSLREKLREYKGGVRDELKFLQGERDSFHDFKFIMNNKLKLEMDHDQLLRTMITAEFIKTFDYLKNIAHKGEKMIQILQVTHKYEIMREKILPYLDEETNNNGSLPQLRLFWQKVAEIQASRYALNEERVYLKKENLKLREEIHKFCECLDCPSLQPDKPEKKRAGMIPYTDAGEMIRKQNKQLCFLNTQTASLDDYD